MQKVRWTKDEEAFVLEELKKWKVVALLPLISMSQELGRTPDSIRRKAERLCASKPLKYNWDKDASKDAFLFYLDGKSTAEILYKLEEDYEGESPTLDQLEQELKRLRDAWDKHIRTYAEERGLPTAKHFKLDTIKFYIENRLTTKDFIRKVLHGKIKNG